DPAGPASSSFKVATPDGEHAFFASPGELTDDANTGPSGTDFGNDLYRYDASSDELTDLTPDQSDEDGAEVQGVLGVSDDGSYVCFAANGALDGGGPASPGDCFGSEGSCNLSLAHGGAITFVARVGNYRFNWILSPNDGVAGGAMRSARVAPDGRTLLFQ